MKVYFKLFTVARIAFANNTAIVITVIASSGHFVAACRRYHGSEKNVSQQYYIFFLHFALAMTMMSLTANEIVTMMAMAPAMIYHCLFYDSYDNSGNYIFSFY